MAASTEVTCGADRARGVQPLPRLAPGGRRGSRRRTAGAAGAGLPLLRDYLPASPAARGSPGCRGLTLPVQGGISRPEARPDSFYSPGSVILIIVRIFNVCLEPVNLGGVGGKFKCWLSGRDELGIAAGWY